MQPDWLARRFRELRKQDRVLAQPSHWSKYGTDVTQGDTDEWIDEVQGQAITAQARADSAHNRIDSLGPGGPMRIASYTLDAASKQVAATLTDGSFDGAA